MNKFTPVTHYTVLAFLLTMLLGYCALLSFGNVTAGTVYAQENQQEESKENDKKQAKTALELIRKHVRGFSYLVYFFWFAFCIIGGVVIIVCDLVTMFEFELTARFWRFATENTEKLFEFFGTID
ncbi:MAG: hypothetical protein ACOC2H_02150 [Spirochaetota bacterium]